MPLLRFPAKLTSSEADLALREPGELNCRGCNCLLAREINRRLPVFKAKLPLISKSLPMRLTAWKLMSFSVVPPGDRQGVWTGHPGLSAG